MHVPQRQARFDWLTEIGGAAALAGAVAFGAAKTAPSFSTVAGIAVFAIGYALMKAVRAEPHRQALPEFAIEPIAGELLLEDIHRAPDDVLLLVDVVEKDDALLLDEVLPNARQDSRVVQLFAAQQAMTAGELKERIDRHLTGATQRAPAPISPMQPDASQALYAALENLKRSLR